MKQNLFFKKYRADGGATFESKWVPKLRKLANRYSYIRIGTNSKKQVRYAYGDDSFRDLFVAAGIAMPEYKRGSGDYIFTFNSTGAAQAAANVMNACIDLGKELNQLASNGVRLDYTTDTKYPSGRMVTGDYSGTHVSYLIPYNAAKAEAERKEKEEASSTEVIVSNNNVTTAENANKAAELEADTEKTIAATKTSKTLRWVGLASIAVIVIILVVMLIRRKK